MTTPDARPISGIRTRLACVLVVDDDARIAQSLFRLLSDEFLVRATSNPREALASLLSGASYDVILCDVMMPGLTGLDLYERLKGGHRNVGVCLQAYLRRTQAARMVFMTGGVGDDHVRAVLDGLPNLLLDKPLDVADLRELVRRRALVDPPRHLHSA